VDKKENCFHCGLPVSLSSPYTALIEDAPQKFCCNGCKAVCITIYEAGLEGFYQRAKGKSLLAPPPAPPENIQVYDLEDVQEEFAVSHGPVKEAQLLVEGIHCAACVWLIERTLAKTAGVELAEVNLSTKKLRLKWDGEKTKLSGVLNRLAQIGYAAIPYTGKKLEDAIKKQKRDSLFRIGFAGFAAMNMMWVSIALWTGAALDDYRNLFHYTGLALATPSLFFSGWPFFKGAWRGLRRLHLTMDLPIAIGASATYLYSSYITLMERTVGEVYFDTVVIFLFIILVGRHLEMVSRNKALDATFRLMELQPKSANVMKDRREEMVSIRAVQPGDLVIIRPGERVAVDGSVVEGESQVDESILTGESHPVDKRIGDKVIAGSLNSNGAITVRVESALKDTFLARMGRLIEEAQASKAPIQRVSDGIVPYFVGATLVLAVLTFFYWLPEGIETALITATSILIITCPCALGMATPMAVIRAAGLGARYGILIKSGEALERLAKATHFAFDKTGAITQGAMRVIKIKTVKGYDEGLLLSKAASAEKYSEHIIARAIREFAKERGSDGSGLSCEKFQAKSGCGVEGIVDGHRVVIGSRKYLESCEIKGVGELTAEMERDEPEAMTSVIVAVNGRAVGLLGMADGIRDGAIKTVEGLHSEGLRLSLLTGDGERVAHAVAQKLGMDGKMMVKAGMSPEDKDREILRLQGEGHVVAMVGDGVNDAPALIRADVGIAMGAGADVSIGSADIVLTGANLYRVKQALDLSRLTLRKIRQNIALSIAYNLVLVPLAMAGYVTPFFAALAMPVSSLMVIANASRIRIE
jgi:Cu2+-exporting ATPase